MNRKEKDILGSKIKELERRDSTGNKINTKYLVVRLDGKNFSRLTRRELKLEPFDERFAKLMKNTTEALIKEFNAEIGYVQSDEITLIFSKSSKETSTFLFDGKVFKFTSILASYAASNFNCNFVNYFDITPDNYACFDCRIIGVDKISNDTNEEVTMADALLWRMYDGRKNAILNYASTFYTPKEMCGLSLNELTDKMFNEKEFCYFDDKKPFVEGTLYYKVTSKERMPEEYKKFKNNEDKEYFFRTFIEEKEELGGMTRADVSVLLEKTLARRIYG